MKVFKLTLFIFLISIVVSNAQLRLIYNETFISNSNDWPIEDKTDGSLSFVEGNYKMEVKLDEYTKWVYAYPDINPDSYFIIETKVTFISIDSGFTFGIIWNVDDNNYNLFKIAKNGNTEGKLNSAGIESLLGKDKAETGFENDETHVFKVKSFSNRCEFYIDDKLCLKTGKLSYKLGRGVGMYVYDKGTALIDHLKIYQEKEEINLVENVDFKLTEKVNLGSNVNTVYAEVQPVISHDGKTLYFSRKEVSTNINSTKDDIYYSIKDASGNFTRALNLGKPINNAEYNSAAGVSADGKHLLVSGRYNADGTNVGDGFCEFTKTNGEWGNPRNLDIKNYYNTNKYCEANYSPDGNAIILTIERADTRGGKDIYVSLRQNDGSWSEPFNAGKTLNTYADEISPFMAGDNKTLYFASEGHSGYGSSDIFISRRLDNTWQNWSKPVNMGPKINSKEWDAYFTIDAKGEWAYIVSNSESIGKADIFKFKIPNELKPDTLESVKLLEAISGNMVELVNKDSVKLDSTFGFVNNNIDTVKENNLQHAKYGGFIHGKVIDGTTGKILEALVEVKEIELNKKVQQVMSDENGFELKLDEGFNYDIYANYTGYVAVHVPLDLTIVSGNFSKEVELVMKKIEKDQTVELHCIFFEEESASLRYDSRGELIHMANMMRANPNMEILIAGHTNFNHQTERYNKKLSEDRAKAVFKALIDLGVERKRMTVKGFGDSQPKYDVNNLWENAKNRRVEFTILEL